MAKRNSYNSEFKKQIVQLYRGGKTVQTLCKEYDLLSVTVYHWIKQDSNSSSFKAKDNRSNDENELIAARKRIKHLEMEVDILKQAALIIGKR